MDLQPYLSASRYIDSDHEHIIEQACLLAADYKTNIEIAKACFEFVRDEIKHSWDYQLNPVTCKASEVLNHGTGFCYAKSHLLAALLRANGIPAGLCYQRLTIGAEPPFCLHGLNAVYLESYGWYRVDPRGNKSGVNAEFCPPVEKLAFPIVQEGEAYFPEIYSEPLSEVVEVLSYYQTYDEVASNLPDIDLESLKTL